MVEGSRSDSETDENMEKSSSDELETCKDESDYDDDGEKKGGGVSEYEQQRMLRIRENRERLESLGLSSLASTLSSVSKVEMKQAKRKGKLRKMDEDDDDEYIPPSDGEEVRVSSSSSSSEEQDEEDDDDDFQVSKARSSSGSRRGSVRKGKNMHSLNTRKARKKLPVQKNTRESDYVDDDEALIQAIALSLGDSSEVSGAALRGPPRNSRADVTDVVHSERKGKGRIKENDGKRKRIKSNTSRVQMSEDQVIIHFFHFDEAGKGNITKKDLQRVATAHDFIWTDKEMADMIHSFDSDGDGKLSLDDFRKIVYRCNMVQGREKFFDDLK